jgi:diguanylate cyclase (GGDEF)-like protein
MIDKPEFQEQLGPQARLEAELFKLESQRRELWVLIIFTVVVMVLGGLSLLLPGSIWHGNELEIKIPPQVLFVIMTVFLVLAVYMMRREVELQKYRLASMQQILAARMDHAYSLIDATTNVFSRSLLRNLLQGEVARAERNSRPLALLMCDLNNFKLVNDRYGHLMGDYVLAQMAGILKTCVRGSDYVVRYGGDEFLLVLPETDQAGAEVVRERIQQRVAEWNGASRLDNLQVTVSVGLYLHVAGQSPDQDVAEADARMYGDKQASRNKAELESSSTSPNR